ERPGARRDLRVRCVDQARHEGERDSTAKGSTMRYAIVFCLFATAAWGQALPDEPGKSLVEKRCTGCHELSTVTRAGYSRAEWLNNIHMMVNVGGEIPKDEIDAL